MFGRISELKRISTLVACFGLLLGGCAGRAGFAGSVLPVGAFAALRSEGPLVLCGDTNRDGQIDEADLSGRHAWNWSQGGAFVIANLDDDDRDGRPDAADLQVNGRGDENDLARVALRCLPPPGKQGLRVTVSLADVPVDGPSIRLFAREANGWRPLDPRESLPAGNFELGLESTRFAARNWNGEATLRAELQSETGQVLASDRVRLRVAPFLLLPNTARTQALYVSTGHPRYENAAFREGLAKVCGATNVRLVTHTTSSWKEMWMQDTMEVGYTQLPGQAPQHVVLGGLRGADSFGPSLLGPDTGYLQVGSYRGIRDGIDDWADWMGNLEVSPPVPGYPFGRVFYGKNTDTGTTLHPEVVAFLEAQQLQAPFWLDTGFLTIKHVDEIANFLPGPDGRPRLLLADTRRAEQLLPGESWPSNASNQSRLDKVLRGGSYPDGTRARGLLTELNLSEDQVVRLPVSYEGGHNVWSNPVNSIYLNGVAVTGAHRVPERIAEDIAASLKQAGARSVQFVDDHRYQDNYGNVHCATNTHRAPLVKDFATWLPRWQANRGLAGGPVPPGTAQPRQRPEQ
ncbi:MAG: protein-arginine deiminase family protein [Candidatus Sericytochromatia bacterium]|nr:protein-arginine deiminase family protein [Candidatus Sericytochromatia bacterium]